MTYCKPFPRSVGVRTQSFGTNPGGFNPAGGHTGNDVAVNVGTAVHAAGDGIIEYAGELDGSYADNLLWLTNYGGKIVVLNCGDNAPSFVYAHLDVIAVNPGDRVAKGQVFAWSGNTGIATTGPHLHYEAMPPGYDLNSPTLGRVNPDIYMTEYPDEYLTAMSAAITELEDDFMPELSAQEQRDLFNMVTHIFKTGTPGIEGVKDAGSVALDAANAARDAAIVREQLASGVEGVRHAGEVAAQLGRIENQ